MPEDPMRFELCDRADGSVFITDRPLCCNLYEHLIVFNNSLYHLNGNILRSSGVYRGDFSGSLAHSVGGAEVVSRSSLDGARTQPQADYLWLGLFQTHFGHFIVGTLSRLWAWKLFGRSRTKLAYIGDRDPDALFDIEYVGFCLTALGIRKDQLHQVRPGDHFRKIRVPDPAFTENYCVASEYLSVLQNIREYARPKHEPFNRLVYISKHRTHRGVRSIIGENDLANCMRQRGAAVICPEVFNFRDQIALWSNLTGVVCGFAGSAFHMAAFATRRRLCNIVPHGWASSNQLLLDKISGNRTVSGHPVHLVKVEPPEEKFDEILKIVDPQRMSDLLVRFVETEI